MRSHSPVQESTSISSMQSLQQFWMGELVTNVWIFRNPWINRRIYEEDAGAKRCRVPSKIKKQALAVASLPVVLVIATTHAVGLSDLRFETRLNTSSKKKENYFISFLKREFYFLLFFKKNRQTSGRTHARAHTHTSSFFRTCFMRRAWGCCEYVRERGR